MLKVPARIALGALVAFAVASGAAGSDLKIRAVKPDANVTIDRLVADGKALVSVVDGAQRPLLGLTPTDFAVTLPGRTAEVVSVQPIAEAIDVPRHLVLVLDNSYSMVERHAVDALLQGVTELLKVVRPIDDVHMVVFKDRSTVKMGGRDLHVATFQSNRASELADFAAQAYRPAGITASTVLYEAILAALELTRGMPSNEPRFLVVFSDGEDLNSSFGREDVVSAARAAPGYGGYAIDYMPAREIDPLLASFADQSGGQAWKARSETNLVPLFQQVAARMEHYYVVGYRFPPSGTMAVLPAAVTIEEIRADDLGEAAGESASATLKTGVDRSELLLRPAVDSVHGITRWRAVIENRRGVLTEAKGEGTPPPEIEVMLPTGDLEALAAGGDLLPKLELQDVKEQSLTVAASPVPVQVVPKRAGLAVTPEVLTIDEIRVLEAADKEASPGLRGRPVGIDHSAVLLRPALESTDWVARWQVAIENGNGTVATAAGDGHPAPELKVPLPTGDLEALAAGGDLRVRMELEARSRGRLVVAAPRVKIHVAQTRAALSVTPARLTVEEIKVIDASPTLAHVYFDKGSSEIPVRYRRISGREEAASFDEQEIRDTLEKHYHLLNIVGRRLRETPSAAITLVGCNDATREEKGLKGLSGRRADAVRKYLVEVWGIRSDRIGLEARDLPRIPSASRSEEGQAENRRVEILATDPAVVAPALSTYTATRVDPAALTLRPEVVSPHGVDRWQIACSNAGGKLADLKGSGPFPAETKIPLGARDLRQLAADGDITVKMELHDRKGRRVELSPAPVKVHFTQLSRRLAEKKGPERVQERYALVLFDFDKATLGRLNEEIVDTIAARIRALPDSAVEIVGHTDTIGPEAYNVKLSERRATEVYAKIIAGVGESARDRVHYRGVGPKDPLYDNLAPETRALNRTVTLTVEYLATQ